MSTPNIDNALTAIEAAEGTIAKLVDKRGAANDRRAALSREIEQYSFAAHAEDDPAAKKKLQICRVQLLAPIRKTSAVR